MLVFIVDFGDPNLRDQSSGQGALPTLSLKDFLSLRVGPYPS